MKGYIEHSSAAAESKIVFWVIPLRDKTNSLSIRHGSGPVVRTPHAQ